MKIHSKAAGFKEAAFQLLLKFPVSSDPTHWLTRSEAFTHRQRHKKGRMSSMAKTAAANFRWHVLAGVAQTPCNPSNHTPPPHSIRLCPSKLPTPQKVLKSGNQASPFHPCLKKIQPAHFMLTDLCIKASVSNSNS